jgi:NADPH:quinone reductase-like Zn-dependent oxidoreductase
MKAITRDGYGSPEVLHLVEVDKPASQEGRVVVQVYASSWNPIDWHEMRGSPFLARLSGGLRKPKDHRLGTDISGEVESIGNNVTKFKPGDDVFGVAPGGFAEYVSAKEDRIAVKPVNISFGLAAAVPVASVTALQGLRDKGDIHSGQKVLVNGASGGVGHFAVQIAKSYGTEVTGVCSSAEPQDGTIHRSG